MSNLEDKRLSAGVKESSPEQPQTPSNNSDDVSAIPAGDADLLAESQSVTDDASVGQGIIWPETLVPSVILDELHVLQMEIRDLQIHIQRILNNEANLNLSRRYINKTYDDIAKILDVSKNAQYSGLEEKLNTEIKKIETAIGKTKTEIEELENGLKTASIFKKANIIWYEIDHAQLSKLVTKNDQRREHIAHLKTLKPAFRHLQNIWEQIKMSALMDQDSEQVRTNLNQEQLTRQLHLMDARLRRMNFQIVVFTIPADIRRWLAGSRSGYYIPFHEFFVETLPDYDDRVTLLKRLAWTPSILNGGLIDLDDGLIYRYATERKYQIRSQLYVGISLFFLTILLILLGEAFNWSISENIPDIISRWAALLVGVTFHILIGTLKRDRPPIISIGEFPLLINAKFGSILVKVAWAFAGFVGYTYFTETGVAIPTVFNYFLVGYGLDSFVGVFSNQLNSLSQAQIEAMTVTQK